MHEYLATFADAHHSGITFEFLEIQNCITVYRYPPLETHVFIQLYSYTVIFFFASHIHTKC